MRQAEILKVLMEKGKEKFNPRMNVHSLLIQSVTRRLADLMMTTPHVRKGGQYKDGGRWFGIQKEHL